MIPFIPNAKLFLFAITLIITLNNNVTIAQVTQDWVQRFNGPGNGNDYGRSLIVNTSGNVYITGSNTNASGYFDFTTIQYDATGIQQWATSYNSGSASEAYSIGVSSAGNIYVVGYSCPPAASADFATVKYNGTGTQQWAQRYNGPFSQSDIPNSVALDGSENVIVTGNEYGAGIQNFSTIKYNSSGVQQWVRTYNGSANSSDGGYIVVTDAADNVYVTGYSTGAGSGKDFTTIKYDAAGAQQWIQLYNGTGNGNDEGLDLKVDESGNVYVTGVSFNGISDDYVTIKYNAAGTQQWIQSYNGPPGNGYDRPRSLVLDASGDLYVTGVSDGIGTGTDYATIKYNSSGIQQWVTRYNGTANGADDASSIALNALGNVFVTGTSAGTGTGNDYATIMYDASGSQQWVQIYNGTANGNDAANDIAINGGCIYVTGSSDGVGSLSDCVTIKYCDASLPVALISFNGELKNGWVELTWTTASETDVVYFTIERSYDGMNYEKILLVHSQGGSNLTRYSAVDKNLLNQVSYYRLSQTDLDGKVHYFPPIKVYHHELYFSIYPIPASTSDLIHINFNAKKMELIIYNELGTEVMKIRNSTENNALIDASSLSKGIFFYCLLDEGKSVRTGTFIIE